MKKKLICLDCEYFDIHMYEDDIGGDPVCYKKKNFMGNDDDEHKTECEFFEEKKL